MMRTRMRLARSCAHSRLEDRFPEERIEWVPAQAGHRKADVAPASAGDGYLECVACVGPTVVMNQDSFGENLTPFLAERFRRTVVVEGSRLDRGLIERERPDIVIQEFVERALMCPTCGAADQGIASARFARRHRLLAAAPRGSGTPAFPR